MRNYLAGLALTLACGFAGAATASASITGFSVSLTDLDVNDGVAPSFTPPPGWTRTEWRAGSETSAMPDGLNGWSAGTITGGLIGSTEQFLEQTPPSYRGAAWRVQQTLDSVSVNVSATAARPTNSFAYMGGGAPFESSSRIVLSANTRATLSFQVAVSATARDIRDPVTGVGEQASAFAGVDLRGEIHDRPDLFPEGLVLANHRGTWSASLVGTGVSGSPLSDSDMGSFSWEVSNPTPAMAYLSMHYRVDASSISAAVPEPGAWALMLFGLATVGWHVKSRHRVRRPRIQGW